MEQTHINSVVAGGMKKALENGFHCPIVKSNLCDKIPSYPFVSFTIITPKLSDRGTDGRIARGQYVHGYLQVWSITVQSDKDEEANLIAMRLHAWFNRVGRLYLNDNGIIVQSLSSIANRDNLIDVRYEFRRGFDVTFGFTETLLFDEPIIETAIFQ